MKLRHKTKKRLALFALAVWLPLYIVVVIELLERFDRPSILVELGIYVGLGILWVLPLKPIFRGVGRADPDGEEP